MDTKYFVRVNGVVDLKASGEAYAVAAKDWLAANEIDPAKMDDVLDAVFNENPGRRLPKSGLITLAVSRMSLNVNQIGQVSDRMGKFIASNPRFQSHKGIGGGIERRAKKGEPIPAIEEKKTAANG